MTILNAFSSRVNEQGICLFGGHAITTLERCSHATLSDSRVSISQVESGRPTARESLHSNSSLNALAIDKAN